MKIIELISEDAKDFTVVKNYDVPSNHEQLSKSNMAKFLKTKFLTELNSLASFLVASERLMKEHSYPHKYIIAAKELAEPLSKYIGRAMAEDLATPNKNMLIDKLRRSSLYFGSIGHEFEDIDENRLATVCYKFNKLLEKSADEMSAIKDKPLKKVKSKEIKGDIKRRSGKVSAGELGYDDAAVA